MTIPAWAVKGAKCVCIDGRGTQMFGLRGGEIFEGHRSPRGSRRYERDSRTS